MRNLPEQRRSTEAKRVFVSSLYFLHQLSLSRLINQLIELTHLFHHRIPDGFHAHSDDYFRGWTFLNHISLLYYYGLLNALRNTKDEKYSAQDVLKLTKNIYHVNTGSTARNQVSATQKKTREVLEAINVDLLR